MDDGYYKLLMKRPKSHDRSIVGLEFVKDPTKKKLNLISFAHDSIKYWNVIASEEDFEIFLHRKINASFCGVQSYDVTNRGRLLAIVSVESTIHTINLDNENDIKVNSFNPGLMEAWFLKIMDDSRQFFTASFSGSLRLLREDGESVKQTAFDKVKLISSLAYSGKYIAVGNSQGLISIVSPVTLLTLFSIEGHACKIRCLQFLQDDNQLLSGSDDKIVKLYTITETKGSLVRNFCGHRQPVMALSVDKGSGGERFCSVALDNRLILWDVSTGDKLHVFENPSADFFTCVTFSPDGRFVAAATDESTIVAYRVPQSENYVEEPVEEGEEAVEDLNNVSMAEEMAHQNGTPMTDQGFDYAPPSTSVTPGSPSQQQPSVNTPPMLNSLGGTPMETPPLSEPYYGSTVNTFDTPMTDMTTPNHADVSISSTTNDNDNSHVEEGSGEPVQEEEENSPSNLSGLPESQQTVNYQEEFERRELEMQLGID